MIILQNVPFAARETEETLLASVLVKTTISVPLKEYAAETKVLQRFLKTGTAKEPGSCQYFVPMYPVESGPPPAMRTIPIIIKMNSHNFEN